MFEACLENAFDFLSEEYARLFERSKATVFQHPIWLHQLYRDLAPRLHAEPVVITVRRCRAGALVALLPLVRRRHGALRSIEFADLDVSDYAAPVCDEALFYQLAGDDGLRARIRELLRPYDILRVKKLPDEAQWLEGLLGMVQRERLAVSTHTVPLHDSFEQWRWQSVDGSYRRALDKKRRKLERKGSITFDQSREPADIAAAMEQLRDQRRARFPNDRLHDARYFDFYLGLAREGLESGLARLYVMRLDGQWIGGVLGLAHRGRFVMLLCGAAIGEYRNYSVGALVFEDVARDSIARGDLVLDFAIGDEPYKQLFGTRPSPLWMVSRGATATGKLALAVGHRAPWMKRIAAGAHNPNASQIARAAS